MARRTGTARREPKTKSLATPKWSTRRESTVCATVRTKAPPTLRATKAVESARPSLLAASRSTHMDIGTNDECTALLNRTRSTQKTMGLSVAPMPPTAATLMVRRTRITPRMERVYWMAAPTTRTATRPPTALTDAATPNMASLAPSPSLRVRRTTAKALTTSANPAITTKQTMKRTKGRFAMRGSNEAARAASLLLAGGGGGDDDCGGERTVPNKTPVSARDIPIPRYAVA
mmetsp:Transcript_31406/g.72225  ORF Transcript_31406/g.72225 Transcript_31406/m.72225 type:complete len:232 (-) Transcript_31406:618-1313(-)